MRGRCSIRYSSSMSQVWQMSGKVQAKEAVFFPVSLLNMTHGSVRALLLSQDNIKSSNLRNKQDMNKNGLQIISP